MMEAAFGQTNNIQVERKRSEEESCVSLAWSLSLFHIALGFGLLGEIDSLINKMSGATFPSSFRNIIMLWFSIVSLLSVRPPPL